jgi:hypothetical protein
MPGLMRGVARTAVIAGTATAVSNRVSRRQAGRWAAQEQQAQPAQPAASEQQAPPAPSASTPSDRMTALKQLAELKDQGVVTEAEFASQKQIILSS